MEYLEKLEDWDNIKQTIYKELFFGFYMCSRSIDVYVRSGIVQVNELFWVDKGSPDAYNAWWPLASCLLKAIRLFTPNFEANYDNLPDEMTYDWIEKGDCESMAGWVRCLRGTALRAVINAMRWMPEDWLMSDYTSIYKQFLLKSSQLSSNQSAGLKRSINRLNPEKFDVKEKSEVFREKLLIKFGYKLGDYAASFDCSDNKQDNFNRFVKTGLMTKTTREMIVFINRFLKSLFLVIINDSDDQ